MPSVKTASPMLTGPDLSLVVIGHRLVTRVAHGAASSPSRDAGARGSGGDRRRMVRAAHDGPEPKPRAAFHGPCLRTVLRRRCPCFTTIGRPDTGDHGNGLLLAVIANLT